MSIVMCRAPFRISFFGGGSDYPEWYRHEPGAVLSTTIDKYIYISCRYLPPFLGTKHRVVWRYVEQVDSIAEILHPAVREGLRELRSVNAHVSGCVFTLVSQSQARKYTDNEFTYKRRYGSYFS